MGNSYFQCKEFIINQDQSAMKVTTDSCLFGAWVAHQLKNKQGIHSVLDIGAGTGLLSLMLAQQLPVTIDGIEIQQNDHGQSMQNAMSSPWEHRLQFINADVNHYEFNKKYDIIISNPPFYESDLKSKHALKNMAHHDAGLTLKGLMKVIQNQMQPMGHFFILLPSKREKEIEEILSGNSLFINEIIYIQQTEKHAPFRIMIQGSKINMERELGTIIIKIQNEYSNAFKELLHPYYLHL